LLSHTSDLGCKQAKLFPTASNLHEFKQAMTSQGEQPMPMTPGQDVQQQPTPGQSMQQSTANQDQDLERGEMNTLQAAPNNDGAKTVLFGCGIAMLIGICLLICCFICIYCICPLVFILIVAIALANADKKHAKFEKMD